MKITIEDKKEQEQYPFDWNHVKANSGLYKANTDSGAVFLTAGATFHASRRVTLFIDAFTLEAADEKQHINKKFKNVSKTIKLDF